MTWKCPECSSRNLTVSAVVEVRLHQYREAHFETDAEGDHEWDGGSLMTCTDCSYCAASSTFEVAP